MKRITILSTIIFALISINTYGFYVSNQTCLAFPNQCSSEFKALTLTPSLNELIIKAGGYYLQSHSNYNLLLKKLELAELEGIDYEELKSLIDRTISSLDSANKLYLKIWETSLILEYDPIIIDKLKSFDYIKYRREKRLLPSVFRIVEKLLRRGDVRGLFQKNYIDTRNLLTMLIDISSDIDLCTVPHVSKMWRTNQSFIEFNLVGQYSSEVFMNL